MPQFEWSQDQFGVGSPPSAVDVRTIIIAAGFVGGISALLVACAVWRIRMVWRRRIALGLTLEATAVRRLNSDDEDALDGRPAFYDVWVEPELGADGERLRWDQIRALASARVLSLPVPRNAEEVEDPFKNYFSSILELVSVERMDRTLLKSLPKDRPVEYAKSELVTSVMIAMPQPQRSQVTESQSLPELEFGIYEGPCPKDHLKEM
ncbi:hypothetical protein M407DRAFT_27085 [Tulasnella calospora MUT 4182]|uniref:Uncharacterized protein n=1 Tax=Tulasnella calospora MUT 4182 TaxID=1051891 RepID=A0A0C3QEG6_9AGAM|nr:hypothetical protein M407DRAFT_27085 [Tulasnella calospora MUT 4182]